MPSRTGAAFRQWKAEEVKLERDGEAYKRLRKDGMQPMKIDGSADLESRATTKFEVNSGMVFDNAAQGKEALDFFSDTFHRDALTPATTPTSDDAA